MGPKLTDGPQFGSIVIEGLGFDTLPTLLLFGASYFSQLLFLLVATVGCTYIRNSRTYFMALNFGVSIAGCCMVRQLPAEMKWARYAGYFLILPYSANFPLYMAMATGNVSGFTKKMTVNAIVSSHYGIYLRRLAWLIFVARLSSLTASAISSDPSSSFPRRPPLTSRASSPLLSAWLAGLSLRFCSACTCRGRIACGTRPLVRERRRRSTVRRWPT